MSPITVTFTFDTLEELATFTARGAVPVAVQAEATKTIEKAAKAPKTVSAKADAVPAPTPTAPETATSTQEPTPEPAPVAPALAQASPSEPVPALTLEVVRAKLAALSQAGKQEAVKALIAAMGAGKLTDIKAEQYADLMAKADKL